MNESSLAKKAYNDLLLLPDEKADWKATIRFILKTVDRGFLLNDPLKLSPFQVKKHMKSKVKALFATKWRECIRQAPVTSVKYRKLRYYHMFKNKFDFSLRQQVAKFRCSDHNLMIQVGRHKNIALENRTCTKCSANYIEDEVHLLIDCSAYQNLRRQYLSHEIMQMINNLKDKNEAFKVININEDPNNILSIAKYLKEAFKSRMVLSLVS